MTTNNDFDYDYNSLTGQLFHSGIEYLPEEFTPKALSALRQITGEGLQISSGAKIATVYGRNGVIEHNRITGPRNPAYASDHDDIILQVTIRVDGRSIKSKKIGFEILSDLIDTVQDKHRETEIKKLEMELEQAEEDAERMIGLAEEKKRQLSALKNLA